MPDASEACRLIAYNQWADEKILVASPARACPHDGSTGPVILVPGA